MRPHRSPKRLARRSGRRAAALVFLALGACATARGVLALRQVDFEVDRVADVHLAGVALDHVRSPRDVSVLDAARIGAAVARQHVPLEFDVHVLGRNPEGNPGTGVHPLAETVS